MPGAGSPSFADTSCVERRLPNYLLPDLSSPLKTAPAVCHNLSENAGRHPSFFTKDMPGPQSSGVGKGPFAPRGEAGISFPWDVFESNPRHNSLGPSEVRASRLPLTVPSEPWSKTGNAAWEAWREPLHGSQVPPWMRDMKEARGAAQPSVDKGAKNIVEIIRQRHQDLGPTVHEEGLGRLQSERKMNRSPDPGQHGHSEEEIRQRQQDLGPTAHEEGLARQRGLLPACVSQRVHSEEGGRSQTAENYKGSGKVNQGPDGGAGPDSTSQCEVSPSSRGTQALEADQCKEGSYPHSSKVSRHATMRGVQRGMAKEPRGQGSASQAMPAHRSPHSPEITEALRERVAMLEGLLAKGSPWPGGPGKAVSSGQSDAVQATSDHNRDWESLPSDGASEVLTKNSRKSRGASRSMDVRQQTCSRDSSTTKSESLSPRSMRQATGRSERSELGAPSSLKEEDEVPDKPGNELGKAPGKPGKGPGKGPGEPGKGPGKGSPKGQEPNGPAKGKGKGPPPKAPPRATPKALGKGNGPAPRKADIKPQKPMKKLFWHPFVLDEKLIEACSNVWATIEHTGPDWFDVEELEHLFSESLTRTGPPPTSHGGSGRRARLRVRVFEDSRRRQVCIMLARLPPVESTVKAVHQMDDAILDKDQVELLLSTAPSAEELAMLRAAAREMPEQEAIAWDDAEAFVWKLSEVSAFSTRLHIWSFENAFEERFFIFHSAVTEMKHACHSLRDSQRVRRLLGLVLAVGNHLNAGTARGRADGFLVDVLPQMRALKGQGGSGSAPTLLDFLVRQAEKTHPGELANLFSDIGEATLVQKACRHKIVDLSNELTTFCLQGRGLARTASSGDEVLALRAARTEARVEELEQLQQAFTEAEEDYRSMCAWFHEGDGRKPRPPDEFFGHWHAFFQGVKAALELMYAGKMKRRKAPRSRILRPYDQFQKTLSLKENVKDAVS
ncbi:unnamed protein product [Effrenium voratum]|uniref:FH2 domain-containing protein n=1 Tax=Effrenium voratum TaxID=2562239 RepID=A0AA36I212_9DINO|nr:unnamed protein product [Effrenium voratum]